MRLLFISFVGNNRWSGMGKWTHSISEQCERLGHSAELWWEDDFPRLRGLGRLAVLLFPIVVAWRLARRRRSFDAVILHEPSAYWYAWLGALGIGVPPLVLMSHGVESRRFQLLLDATRRGFGNVQRGSRWKTPLMRLWQSDGALRRADHIICLSSYDRSYLAEKLGIAPGRVSLMINGVDPADFAPGEKREFSGRVLFLGSWLDAKGSLTLPRIWPRVLQEVPSARLTLLGTGVESEAVLNGFAEEVRGSIDVIPRVEPAEVAWQMSQHDIFFLPSLNEGSPLALLEALSAGLPTVAGDAGGIPDIVRSEAEGLLFPPLDIEAGVRQLVRVLQDDGLRGRLSAGGLRRARELGWDQAAATLLDAVGSVTGGAKRKKDVSSGLVPAEAPLARPETETALGR